MKKAKIVLTSIIVLATVSGAVAFKAHKLSGDFYCSSSFGTGTNCGLNAGDANRYIQSTSGSTLHCIQNPGSNDLQCPSATTDNLQQVD